MTKSILIFTFSIFTFFLNGQIPVDMARSVPVWMEFDSSSNQPTLKWIADNNAENYYLGESSSTYSITDIATLNGSETFYQLDPIEIGKKSIYHLRKDNTGRGIITIGVEIPIVHQRGRCLVAIDDILVDPLVAELDQMIQDLQMDGWKVDTIHVNQIEEVTAVKSSVVDWYDSTYEKSQALYLLGHIPVPYSGNSAHDGHANHQGAWAADSFYGDIDGNWTDVTVNNVTPARVQNRNIPNDGKYDQTTIPSDIEIEIGRVDFYNLPAFSESQIELTRQYLVKNHDFKVGNKEYPRRALVENNFGNLNEGFGQSGWRNFSTLFGGDSVSVQDYNAELENEKYLFSYAAGGGSYTSCSGVGTTQNFWAAKEIKTIFTLNFGSYFGDWDSQNNFMRAALGSGDVLTNGWAGRPAWQLYDMALGKNIGYCAKLSQNASGTFFNQGFSARATHIALMGDPTLRLHAVKRPENLIATFDQGDIELNWDSSPDASHGYIVYRKTEGGEWVPITELANENFFIDNCVASNMQFDYMVKAVRLEDTGSGSYFNTSLGITTNIISGTNNNLMTFFVDLDGDGYGDMDSSMVSCLEPTGFVQNDLDCDDTNVDINPDAIEIPSNGVDENCDGDDFIVSINDPQELNFEVYPNPSSGLIQIVHDLAGEFTYRIYNVNGQVVQSGNLINMLDLSIQPNGLYWLELHTAEKGIQYSTAIHLLQ